jgi:hypothetical protein
MRQVTAMAGSDPVDQARQCDGAADAQRVETQACVALVPVARSASAPEKPGLAWSRPSSIFVAHLIATAARAPQTRELRRATASDAQIAYVGKRPAFSAAGARTRQTI